MVFCVDWASVAFLYNRRLKCLNEVRIKHLHMQNFIKCKPMSLNRTDDGSTARRYSLHGHLRWIKSENPHKLEAKSKGNDPNILIVYQNTCQLILSKTYVCDQLTDGASLGCSARMEVALSIVRTQLQRWTRNFWTNKKSVSRPPHVGQYQHILYWYWPPVSVTSSRSWAEIISKGSKRYSDAGTEASADSPGCRVGLQLSQQEEMSAVKETTGTCHS